MLSRPLPGCWDTSVSLAGGQWKLTSEMFLTPPRPAPSPSCPAPDGKCSRIFKPGRRVSGCCAGSGAEGMKYSCSPARKRKRMDTLGWRVCLFIQLRPSLIKLLAARQVTAIFFTSARLRLKQSKTKRRWMQKSSKRRLGSPTGHVCAGAAGAPVPQPMT